MRAGRARLSSAPDLPHAEETPLAEHAPERVRAAVFEADARARYQIFYSVRDQNLARRGLVRDAHAYLGRDAADLAAHDVALARVQPRAHLYAEARGVFDNRVGAAHGARGAVEYRERAVADHVYLAPAEPLDLLADVGAQALYEPLPAARADARGALLRVHDAREEHGGEYAVGLVRVARARQELFDLVEHRVLVADERQVVAPRQLH